jgi:hypothetical protein
MKKYFPEILRDGSKKKISLQEPFYFSILQKNTFLVIIIINSTTFVAWSARVLNIIFSHVNHLLKLFFCALQNIHR